MTAAEKALADKQREAKLHAYRELMIWARMEIADSVMRFGFTQLNATLERILHVYRQFQKDFE